MGYSSKSRVGSPDSVSLGIFEDVNLISFIFGIFLFVLGIVDMIVLYYYPNSIIKSNKKKYPNSVFLKPDTSIIAIHFTLHSLLILLGIFLIIYSFDFILNLNTVMVVLLSCTSVLIFIFWVVALCLGFTKTHPHKSQVTTEQMSAIINTNPPINFIYIYTKGRVSYQSCTTKKGKRKCTTKNADCYSKSGIKFPVKSDFFNGSYNYDFKEIPDMFYFNFGHELNISANFALNFYNLRLQIEGCESKYSIVFDNYPQIEGTYIVTSKKLPAGLTQGS